MLAGDGLADPQQLVMIRVSGVLVKVTHYHQQVKSNCLYLFHWFSLVQRKLEMLVSLLRHRLQTIDAATVGLLVVGGAVILEVSVLDSSIAHDA